jgi:YesN/AraC family two-component response regulator
MYYLLKGSRVYFTNKTSYTLEEDCIYLTKPNVLHGTRGSIFTRILINFDEIYLRKYFNEDFVKELLECFSYEMIPSEIVRANPKIKKFFLNVHNSIQNQDFFASSINLASLLDQINKTTSAIPKISTYEPQNIDIESVWKYIEDNLKTIENVSQIAEHFHFSKYYFCHFFKKRTGRPVIEYVCAARIQQAQKLLIATNKTIEEVAFEVGFKDRSYFCLTFKKKVGIPPATYRRTYKKADPEKKKLLLKIDFLE